MIKIAVCDDEKNIRSYLVSLIKKQGRECSITEYDSADAYLSDDKEHDILLCLDGCQDKFCLGRPYRRRNHNIVLYLKDGNKACGDRLEYYAKIGDLEEELAG